MVPQYHLSQGIDAQPADLLSGARRYGGCSGAGVAAGRPQCRTGAVAEYQEPTEEYFRANLKNADVPVLIGTLISATPAELVVNLSGDNTPEVTLVLKDERNHAAHLNGPLAPGSQIQFRGVPVAFTREPFMLTFDVETVPPKASAP